MELFQKWAGKQCSMYDTEGNPKEWYDNVVQHCVDIGNVETDHQSLDYYVKNNLHRNSNIFGIIGTIKSSKFMNGYPSDPDKNRPDLILSIHGITPGDILEIGTPQYDLLGEGPDFTFLQPFNQCGSPYSPGRVITTHSSISIRCVWILDHSVFKKCLHHSSKTQKIMYDKDGKHPFCIYRGVHIPWECRHFNFWINKHLTHGTKRNMSREPREWSESGR